MEWVYWLIFVVIAVVWVVLMIYLEQRDIKSRTKPKDLRHDIDTCQTKIVELINNVNYLTEEVKKIEGDIYEDS